MPENNKGRIVGVNGNLLTVEFDSSVIQNEVAYVILGDLRLKAEVIRIRGNRADLQVFESTNGIRVGDMVEFGGLLGEAPVMPVHPESAEEFIARGGRIPAPMQSLKN